MIQTLLRDPARRPAIVYAPSRKDAVALAEQLGAVVPAAAYHAGMSAASRESVQNSFLRGSIDVMVATVAFGMGIDKADVRTVAHLALPQTLEGYYQEIGRAGRDGKPSRAVLLHSYVDRITNEFFHKKNYPPVADLNAIFTRLTAEPQPKHALQARTKMDEELFDSALEKLWIHGGAIVDPDESVRRGDDAWAPSYEAQVAHRLEQSEQMGRFAQSHGCRMVHIIRHFGDEDDHGRPCGLCDTCASSDCTVQSFRTPTSAEVATMQATLDALAERNHQSIGTLHRNQGGAMERHEFELLVSTLVRAGFATIRADVFEKGGKSIPFQRLTRTSLGEIADARKLAALQVPVKLKASGKKPHSRRKSKKPSKKRAAAASPRSSKLDAALRAWRTDEATKKRVPAFRIMSNKVLAAIAAARPEDEAALLAVHGVGPSLVTKHGVKILRLVREA
jgi:DNA topoisomerase III